jgi:malate dehydrogenase
MVVGVPIPVLGSLFGHVFSDFDVQGRSEVMRRKVTVIGAGNVGATVAQRIVEKELADVVLVDVIEGVPQGKGLDMIQSGAVEGFDMRIVGSNGYEETEGSDLVILTAGLARKPGMSRDDLLRKNEEIVAGCISKTTRGSRDLKVIVVTNPLDAMCEVVRRITKLPKQNVIGMAGILDSARMRAFISMELGVSMTNIHATVLGGHGDTMVPLPRYSTVAGVPITELMSPERVAAIVKRTAGGGAEIVNLLKTGSAYYAPSAAAVEMAEAIFNDRKKILPCAAYLEGEYGINGVFVGVPVVLGKNGIERIIELKLTPEESAALKKSAASVQELVGLLTV